MYVYKHTQTSPAGFWLYTVGFYAPDGKWIAESDHDSETKAAGRVHWLNGGDRPHVNVAIADELAAGDADEEEVAAPGGHKVQIVPEGGYTTECDCGWKGVACKLTHRGHAQALWQAIHHLERMTTAQAPWDEVKAVATKLNVLGAQAERYATTRTHDGPRFDSLYQGIRKAELDVRRLGTLATPVSVLDALKQIEQKSHQLEIADLARGALKELGVEE